MTEISDRTVRWYVEKAKKNCEFESDRKLSLSLGKNPSLVHYWLSGKAAPSPEMMVKLAPLAGVPVEVALADLGYWTNFDTEAAPAYEEMASIVAKAKNFASVSLIGAGLLTSMFATGFTSPVEASEAHKSATKQSAYTLYYGKYIQC